MEGARILPCRSAWARNILILAFVIIVIGGSVLSAARSGRDLVGMIDTLGRAFLPDLLRRF